MGGDSQKYRRSEKKTTPYARLAGASSALPKRPQRPAPRRAEPRANSVGPAPARLVAKGAGPGRAELRADEARPGEEHCIT